MVKEHSKAKTKNKQKKKKQKYKKAEGSNAIVHQDGMDIMIKVFNVHIPRSYTDKQNTI